MIDGRVGKLAVRVCFGARTLPVGHRNRGWAIAPSWSGLRGRYLVEGGEQVVERAAGAVEGIGSQELPPLIFELGDGGPGGVEQPSAFGGGKDQLGSPVGGIGTTGEVAEPLELVDQGRTGGEPEVGAVGQGGEPDAVDTDVAPDLEVGEAQVDEAAVVGGLVEQVAAEVTEEPEQQLADGQSIRRKSP
jgi:hypothetical protein